MTDRDLDHLTEEEAARLWQRAVKLQADAARAAEAEESDESKAADVVPREGYAVEHVRAAAIEAGISGEYLDAALADLRAERAIPKAQRSYSFLRWFLKDPKDAITVRRVIDAPASKVLAAMEEVFPNEPYTLSLKDRQGDPLNGGLLIFNIEGVSMLTSESGGFKGQAAYADLREVYVSLLPIEGSDTCEVTLRGPVSWAFALNAAGGSVIVGVGGGLGLAISWAIGSAVAGALIGSGIGTVAVAGAVAATIAAGGTLGAAGLSTKGFRALYNHSMKKGQQGLEGLLSAVAMKAQGGWGFGASEEGEGATPAVEGSEPKSLHADTSSSFGGRSTSP